MGKKKSKVPPEARLAKSGKSQNLKVRFSEIPWEKVGLLAILLILAVIQTRALFLPKSEFEKAKEGTMKDPADLEARLVLAEELLKNNRLGEAEKELKKISNFQFPISNEEQIRKIEKLWQEKQESDPQDLEVLIQKWQEILQQKPDYRDGWLKLSLYLIKVGKINEAQEALEKAKELDPNYEVIKEIENLIFSPRPV